VFLSNFAPTDTTCYHAAFLNTTTGWAKYDVLPPKYGLASSSPPKLSLSGVFGAYDTQTKFYSITGSITNEDDSTVYLPKAIGTLYDKNGDVLGCMAAYIDGTSLYLQPDRTASFKITFDERDYKDVTRFRLQADGFIP
jgi:hypothetical protein